MYYNSTNLTPELQSMVSRIKDIAEKNGLDCFPTIFELIDYNQLAEIAAYGGFPTRYPHWRFGMEYERIAKSYEYGLSIIYEMVINNNPCYAYLLRANSLVMQKTVVAHVYGHCDFFKNNFWFQKTNRKMLDQMANHATFVRRLINEIGHDTVENFIDTCLSIENLIDIQAPSKPQPKENPDSDDSYAKTTTVGKIKAKSYMDKYINPKDFMDAQQKAAQDAVDRSKSFPEKPERDVLKFLIDFAPMNAWQKRVLQMVREESYYFAPQGQTKIMNEGWATYWHSKMMTELAPVDGSEIVDYCDHYAGVVAAAPGSLNPYKMGVELFRHIERRWNRGQFGLDYLNCDEPRLRKAWDKKTGLGKEKIFEARRIHNDITFIDEFLDEDFCHEHKMFIYDYDKRSGQYVISSRSFRDVKNRLLAQLTNFGQPIITIQDGNFRNRNELLLRHNHDGTDLKMNFAQETLKNIHTIWSRPVHLETMIEGAKKRISFDGTNHEVEKVD